MKGAPVPALPGFPSAAACCVSGVGRLLSSHRVSESSPQTASGGAPLKIALTGATGFVGQHVATRLRADGHWVRALCRRLPPDVPGIEWVPGDLSASAALARLTMGTDVLIHCAGQTRGLAYKDFSMTNVAGLSLLARILEKSPSCRRLLFISSLAARHPELSHYARSKRAAEACLQANRCLDWTIFRPPAIYGPGDRELLPLLKAMGRGFATVPANQNSRLSLLFVADLADAVVSWLETGTSCSGATYEIHDGREGGYSWVDILHVAASLRGAPVRGLRIPGWLLTTAGVINETRARMFGSPPMLSRGKARELRHHDWVCSNDAISADLHWRPKFDLAAGLMATPGWLVRP